MNSSNPELNWNTVTKGRRSRKSMARNFNANAKTGNSISPKRVGDFSVSDSDKLSEAFCGPLTSSKSENVPLKKRRHLLQTSRSQDASPLRSRHLSEEHGYLSLSGQRTTDQQAAEEIELVKLRFSRGFDHMHLRKRNGEYDDADDFSGIELLAAAASMDDENENYHKVDLIAGKDPIVLKQSDASSSVAQLEIGLNCKPGNAASNMAVDGGNADSSRVANTATSAFQSLGGGHVDVALPKVNRQHWDLNTLMDAWDEPYDDSVSGNTSKDVNNEMHMENRQVSVGHEHGKHVGTGDEPSDLKMEEKETTYVSPDTICSQLPGIAKHVPEPPCVSFSEKEQNAGMVSQSHDLSCNADMETLNQVVITDPIISSSEFRKPCCSTGELMSQEKIESASGSVDVKNDEDCSQSLSKTGRTAVSDTVETAYQDTFAHNLLANEASEATIAVKSKGSCPQYDQSVHNADAITQTDGTYFPGSSVVGSSVVQSDELVAKLEENSFPNDCPKEIAMESLFRNYSARAKLDDPASAGKVGPAIDAQHDSDVSQDVHFDMENADDLQEGYDSPYEDGELRGSFSYSLDDNELENECVDYESDGRNGDGSDAADYPGSEIVEGGSDGSHGTQRRNSAGKRLPDRNEYNSGPVRHFRRHFAKEDYENNERTGKGSNAGSGTTDDQSMEMNAGENDGIKKRRHFADRRETIDVKIQHMNEYASKTSRVKLHSRIEGRSCLDATNEKDAFFSQPYRQRRLGFSYSRVERDMSPDRHIGRYRPAAHGDERDVDRQWTSWGSRRRYTSGYQGSEARIYSRPRSVNGDLDKIGGLDPDIRQTGNYMLKGLHRPLMKSPSDRDEYFGMRKRVPLTRGFSGYRSRGNYSQRAGRDFGDDYEPMPDDTGVLVRMPRYIPRRDRSFSPNSGTRPHMLLPPMKSRSRSRTRSPRAWRPHKERIMSVRRQSRSPDFRSDARMERVRAPFPKTTFAPDYEDEYISPSRGRFPLHQNSRWVDDHAFAENNHLRHRRSPVRVFRRTQRFDSIGSSGRLKEEEYFSSRRMIRPGRFMFKPSDRGGRESKFESNYDDRRCGKSGEMLHRGLNADENGNVRRFRHSTAGDFEASNLNNEDDGRATDTRGAPQTPSDRDEKRAIKI